MILELPGFDPDPSEFLEVFKSDPTANSTAQWPKVIVGAGDFFASSFSSRPSTDGNHLVGDGGPLAVKNLLEPLKTGDWDLGPKKYPTIFEVYVGLMIKGAISRVTRFSLRNVSPYTQVIIYNLRRFLFRKFRYCIKKYPKKKHWMESKKLEPNWWGTLVVNLWVAK